jgi:hypothetical protein
MVAQTNAAAPTTCFSEITNEIHLATSLAEGDFKQVGQDLCEHFKGSVIEAVTGPFGEAAAIALCFERLLVAEAALAGVAIRSGTVEVLVPLSEFAPELALAALIVDSVICAALVPCFINTLLDQSAGFCDSSSTTTYTTTSTTTSTTSSRTSSRTSSPLAPIPAPGPPPSLAIPSVAGDPCASCELSVYAIGVMGLASQCRVAVPMGDAYDLSVLLCDSSYGGRYASFCQTLCANQCATYNINDWIKGAGSSYMSDASLATCSALCTGFKGDGGCKPANAPAGCICGVGADTCVPC